MSGEDRTFTVRSLEARKELAILACSADRLELELLATRARRREEELSARYPRAWPWIQRIEALAEAFGPDAGSGGIRAWIAALKPLIAFFRASA